MPDLSPRSFRPEQSQQALLDFLASLHIDLETATLRAIVESMLAFYQQVRAAGLDSTPDSDMLLFEWGVYDWGEGENFQFGIARQFVEAEEQDDDAMSQLHLIVHLPPTVEARQLPPGNYWCDGVAYTPELRRFIFESEAFRLADSLQRRRVELYWSYV